MSTEPNASIEAAQPKKAPAIRVVGVGGAGLNAVGHMMRAGLSGLSFAGAHSDARLLAQSTLPDQVLLGARLTRGLGAGGDPDIGRAAAEEDAERLRQLCGGCDLLVVVAGLGGGTGSGAGPVIAQLARESGALVLALVALPFDFESQRRQQQAQLALRHFKTASDAVICLPNQKVAQLMDENTALTDAFRITNDMLVQGVRGILHLVTREGLINVDFADVRTVMAETGMAMMGTGVARGENRARDAAEAAVSSPLLEDVNLQGAHGLLINVTAGLDLRTSEFSMVGDTVKNYASEDANVVVGCVIDPEMQDEIRVTVVATGIGRPQVHVQPQPEMDSRRGMTAIDGGRVPRLTKAVDDLNVPTYIRNQREQHAMHAAPRRAVGDGLQAADESMLDIPAFLRRQAD